MEKQFNKRFHARPDYVRIAESTEQVVSAVQDAVRRRHDGCHADGVHFRECCEFLRRREYRQEQ